MVSDPLTAINLRATPQTQPADPRQVLNHAGGYTFQVDDMARLRRFLVLGVATGTYYQGERELTRENADLVLELARTRGSQVVEEILRISTAGRAPKQNPALFTLAAVAGLGDAEARRAAAVVALPHVARTGAQLLQFLGYAEQFRGWGRILRRGVGRWFSEKDPDALAYQMVKYRSRGGWSMRDALRLAHPAASTPEHAALYDFACGRHTAPEDCDCHDGFRVGGHMGDCPKGPPLLVEAFIGAQSATDAAATAQLVRAHRLPWEALQPDHLASPVVWEALLDARMPQTALLRNLARMTRIGVLAPGTDTTRQVAFQLATGMAGAKVHPLNVLTALRTYASGTGFRGTDTWTPVPEIIDALDAGFYEAFGGVEAAGKRTLLAVDVSGSMAWGTIAGSPLTPREAAAAMAMVTAATEPAWSAFGFSDRFVPLDISPRRRLDDAVRAVSGLPFSPTNCSLPMVHAKRARLKVDTFVVLTDNETYAGVAHPHQALEEYRQASGIDARLVVCGMTATDISIANPSDAGMLDVVGLDSSTPTLISDFSAGRI